jgi:hypothetical protein
LGFDLVWGQSFDRVKKVGFATVDHFQVTDLLSLNNGEPIKTPPVLQMEFEILPGSMDFYRRNEVHFVEFFRRLENRYQMYENHLPKYRQKDH